MKPITINITNLIGTMVIIGNEENASAQIQENVADTLLKILKTATQVTDNPSRVVNTQTHYNYQEKGFVLGFSSSPSSRKSRLQKDLIELKISRLRFLETLGLKHESELWIGKKINPELLERAYCFQNHIRKIQGGRKKSRNQAYKAMLDAIEWFGFSPC